MNENNNLNINDEKINNNMKPEIKKNNNNKILYVIIGILIVSIIGCVFLLMNKSDDKKEEQQEETIIEKEDDNEKVIENEDIDEDSEEKEFVNPNSEYEYLIDRLYGASCSSSPLYKKNFDINNLDNQYILNVAINNLYSNGNLSKKVEIPTTSEYYDFFKDSGNTSPDGYSSEQVLENAKKILGKNIKIKMENVSYTDKIELYYYIKELDTFVMNPGIGCTSSYHTISEIISVNKQTNKLEIVVAVSEQNYYEQKLYNVEGNLIVELESIDAEEYVYNNADKFNQYKFTFTLEDGNYIFTGIEKIK